MAELKPCPFCNETKRLFVEKAGGWENDFYVHCYGCSTFGPSGNDDRDNHKRRMQLADSTEEYNLHKGAYLAYDNALTQLENIFGNKRS